MLHVAAVPRSVQFYGLMGFDVGNTFKPDGATELSWAWLETGGGATLMVTRASGPVDPEQQAVLFYLYCDDVQQMQRHLAEAGVKVSEIHFPFYSPKGEFRVADPDGYCLMVSHS
jgi:predicted enzyme related to lactoylglutathione lyase